MSQDAFQKKSKKKRKAMVIEETEASQNFYTGSESDDLDVPPRKKVKKKKKDKSLVTCSEPPCNSCEDNDGHYHIVPVDDKVEAQDATEKFNFNNGDITRHKKKRKKKKELTEHLHKETDIINPGLDDRNFKQHKRKKFKEYVDQDQETNLTPIKKSIATNDMNSLAIIKSKYSQAFDEDIETGEPVMPIYTGPIHKTSLNENKNIHFMQDEDNLTTFKKSKYSQAFDEENETEAQFILIYKGKIYGRNLVDITDKQAIPDGNKTWHQFGGGNEKTAGLHKNQLMREADLNNVTTEINGVYYCNGVRVGRLYQHYMLAKMRAVRAKLHPEEVPVLSEEVKAQLEKEWRDEKTDFNRRKSERKHKNRQLKEKQKKVQNRVIRRWQQRWK